MVALWNKGSDWQEGKNSLARRMSHPGLVYPENAGIHAELDLWRGSLFSSSWRPLSLGMVAVAGVKQKNALEMENTRPCAYCATILFEARVSHVVYMQDGELFKAKVAQLIYDPL